MGIIQASIPLFFVLMAVELAFAALGRRPFYRLNDSISDLSAGTLSQLAGIFTKVLTVGIFAWVAQHARLQLVLPLPEWPAGVPFPRLSGEGADAPFVSWSALGSWVVVFTLVDLAYYWFHRVSHEVNVFWAGHVVHHSSEEYNLAVALRQSALGGLLSWLFYIPLALVGVPWQMFVACYGINLVYQFWIHTRAIERLPRWAEAFLNTPSHHRVHHGVNPRYQDRNYAGVFIVWDRWFGSFTPETEEPVYGLTKPLRSWNPIWVQIHGYVTLARDVARATSMRDRWHLIFGAPGWRPATWGGPVVLPEVSSRSFLKFDPAVPVILARYAFVHFVCAIPPALLLLQRANSLTLGAAAAGTFYVALTLTNVGGVLEGRRWAFAAEQARLGALGASALVLMVMSRAPRWATACGALACAISSAVLWWQRAAFTLPSSEAMDVGDRVRLLP